MLWTQKQALSHSKSKMNNQQRVTSCLFLFCVLFFYTNVDIILFMEKIDILRQLNNFNHPKGTPVLIHTALRLTGVEGKLLLDALIEHFTKDGGLLCIPTHTWHNLKKDIVLDTESDDSCLGILSRIAIRDKRGIRSKNPTHSMVVFGNRQKAQEFIKDEEFVKTPTAPESCYGKLYSEGGYVLLIGVAHDKNTYLHAVDEILGTPNRMEDKFFKVKIKSDTVTERDFKLFYCDYTDDISWRFTKFETAFRYHRAIQDGFVGNAPSQLCDAKIMKDVIEKLYKNSDCDPLSLNGPIPQKWYV